MAIDIVVADNEEHGAFGAILSCSQEQSIKILRKETSDCPVKAVRAMVERLQKDTGHLFSMFP